MSSIEKKYWRSMESRDLPESENPFVTREFQEGASEASLFTRREFIKLMGASVALAGLAGCNVRLPKQKIRPYAQMPESATPGIAQHYATVFSQGDRVTGLVVESHDGRPTKVEGNVQHPFSLGATGIYEQASVLDLYDPDRVQHIKYSGEITDTFSSFISKQREAFSKTQGEGLAILVETQRSASYVKALQAVKAAFPKALIYRYDSVNQDAAIFGLKELTGQAVLPYYRFDKADVILALDSDFLGRDPLQVPYSKAFAARRDPDVSALNRLYVVENTYTLTGSKADHRFRSKTSDLSSVAVAVAFELSSQLGSSSGLSQALSSLSRPSVSLKESEIKIIVRDLIQNRGKSLITVGATQPAAVHQLVYLMNEALSNNGASVVYYPVPFGSESFYSIPSVQSISNLTAAIRSGSVSSLFVLGGDPVYSAPADLEFAKHFKAVKNTVHVTSHFTATTLASKWSVGRTHYLENWGDAVALDGTVSICQPLISPMYEETLSDLQVLLMLSGSMLSEYDFVRDSVAAFGGDWDQSLASGIFSSSKTSVSLSANPKNMSSELKSLIHASGSNLELVFLSDYCLYDGRYANNAWLQELPDPMSKMVWDNPLLVSPKTASELKLSLGDKVRVVSGKTSLELPVFIMPGHADRSFTVTLGSGQTSIGRVGNGSGFDVSPLRTTSSLQWVSSVTVIKLNEKYPLATTQEHGSMEGRPLYREADLEYYKLHPHFASEMVETPPLKSLFEEHVYDTGYQWGLSIDLARCTGCNACMIACQSENNIPVVGKSEAMNGRDMSWIRIDRYFEGDLENPDVVEQPVTCLQCENAPCEQVCPVAATVHSHEGLNDMVYNRCIGTRYCLDNCPVKVRRFNFFDYHQRSRQSQDKKRYHLFDYMKEPATSVQMQFNPDVTVRMRGVMEKCTYCVQRINEARHVSANEKRSIRDGEILTACQQVCPSEAIVFGNILDENSAVSKLKKRNRMYHILEQLHLKARTSYLASIRNPNPLLEKKTIEKEVTHHG